MTALYPHNHHPHPPPLDQHTPQSPPFYMSANHAASSNNSTTTGFHSSVAAGVSPPHSSPSFSSSNPRQPPIATTTTILTPTSSAAGTVPPTTLHEDTDGDTNMEDDDDKSHKRRRTSSPYDRNAQTTAPALRHRTASGSQGYMPDASTPIPSEHDVLSQPGVSTYYLVCPKPHEPSYPDLTDNLLALYSLRPIADSVARFNPATGVKNKLRKSYKGFINDLPGKNIVVTKAAQTEPNSGDGSGDGNKVDLLGTLLMWPEEEWYNQNVHGKEMSKGLDMNKLRKGLNMTKGDIPGFDASILGLEDELRRKTPHTTATPAVAVGTPYVNGSTPGGASSVSGAGGDDARPKRKKRRRYDDTSYEGYGDFEGEDDAPVNNGSGGNGPGVGMVGSGGWNDEKKKKKRKKVKSSRLMPRCFFSLAADGLVHRFRPALCGDERKISGMKALVFILGLGCNAGGIYDFQLWLSEEADMNSPSAGGVGVGGGMNMSHHVHHGGGITVHSGSLYGRWLP